MFINVMRWETRPESWDEAMARFRSEAVPLLERQPGFLRVLVSGDALGGRGMVHTLWQAEEHARRFERSGGAARMLELFAAVFTAAPDAIGYPVLLDREF